MENTSKRLPRPENYVNLIPQGLFLLSILLSVVTTYYVTGHYIDSDASSELVLAKHLAETGQILSQDWYYSTELRVLNTQLVYAPLFLIFEDWHMVRFAGALILQGIMILSYYFLLHEAGVSKRVFFLSAALLLLPVSVAYGRIVLYHCFYIPHIALSFFLVGLTLGFAQKISWRSWKPWLRLFLLLLFSFIGGLGGIRQLMITHAPLVLCIILMCLITDFKNTDKKAAALFIPNNFRMICISSISAIAAFVGMKVNSSILSQFYHFSLYEPIVLHTVQISNLGEILFGFFHQFGYRRSIPVLSILGILSLSGLFCACYSVYISAQKLLDYSNDNNFRESLLETFFLIYTILMLVIFLFTGGYVYILYFTFCLPWAVPTVISSHEKRRFHFSSFHASNLLSWITIACLFVNGYANAAYFNGIDRLSQPYEGLSYTVLDKQDQLADAVQYLSDNGYDIGYATFWEGNIITEMSDGIILTNNINLQYDENGCFLYYFNWLTSDSLRNLSGKRAFLLIPYSNKGDFQACATSVHCKLVFDDSVHCIYEITDFSQFVSQIKYP